MRGLQVLEPFRPLVLRVLGQSAPRFYNLTPIGLQKIFAGGPTSGSWRKCVRGRKTGVQEAYWQCFQSIHCEYSQDVRIEYNGSARVQHSRTTSVSDVCTAACIRGSVLLTLSVLPICGTSVLLVIQYSPFFGRPYCNISSAGVHNILDTTVIKSGIQITRPIMSVTAL